MYLTSDAKLWWRTCFCDDASANCEKVETWVASKKELKDLPYNTSWLARKVCKLKHVRKVTDYVKEFNSVLLDVRDMSEEDNKFNFLVGLQLWAQVDLRRQGIKDLLSAIVDVDHLIDYRVVGGSYPDRMKKDAGKDKGKTGKTGKDSKFKKKKLKDVSMPKTKESQAQHTVDKMRKDAISVT